MHNPEQHNAELEEATKNLITNVVPNFAPELAKLIAEVPTCPYQATIMIDV
jgi:hypothetical protein